jgi:glycosyltransferase involved in cell wall biosynthesis
VLTGFPNYPDGLVYPDYRRAWHRGLMRERQDGVEIYRTWLYPAANQGTWKRSIYYGSFALSASAVGPWLCQPPGVVIATSPPILVGAAGYLVAAARRLPFVFEVRDLWPESLEAVGVARRSSLFYRGLERLASFLYQRADRIVVDGEWKRRALAAAGVKREKVVVIPNGVADDFWPDPEATAAREARQRTRAQLGLDGGFLALYAGTLGMAHGLDTVLLAAHKLRSRSDIIFVLIGDGADRERLEGLSRELRLSNVRFLGKQPRQRIPDYLSASDVCLIPLRRSGVFKTAIPSKMFEAMAASKPVLLGVEGEAQEILCEARAGLVVTPEDPQALAEATLELVRDPALRRQMGENGRRAALEKYSRKKMALLYLEVLENLKQ